MGKIAFMHILDEFGKVQLYAAFDKLGEKNYEFLKLLDMGDWIGAEGHIFKTRTGEITVEVSDIQLLSKSLRPLPEKWHGLSDIEQRYRKRYVDLIISPQVREVFKKRTAIIQSVKEILDEKGFLEVDTPCLQPIYGGAAARPFISHLNALDMKVYMRISNELYLKRLIVGGFEKIYEFARDFRNEDIDRTHNPEFTQVELYQAYADFNTMMEITEEIYERTAKKVLGTTIFEYQGHQIDLKRPWQRYSMVEAITKFADINVEKLTDRELFDLRITYNLQITGEVTRGKMIQALFEELVEGKLIQPTFITHHPVESTPLCKPCREHPLQFAERFEPFIAKMEIGNAFSELNDPILQRKLLEDQSKELNEGSQEAHPMDEDFIQAIEYGMPPTGGLGLGIDRMVMILTNQASIRDVL
ncbi:MAG: lysine--tRNA ligase, partial [Nanoarchaeota archaeon]